MNLRTDKKNKWPGLQGLYSFLLVSLLAFSACDNSFLEELEKDILEAAPKETYTVSYDGNEATGGTVPVDLNRYEEGSSVTVQGAGSLTKYAHEFFHWNTADDDTGTTYLSGPTLVMGSEDIILYAIWTELPVYTVTFNSQGGSAVSGQEVMEGYPVTEPATPTRTGYSFSGWFQESSCTNPWDFSGDTGTAETYTVSFDTRGGTAASPASMVVTFDEIYGTLATTSRTFYVFDGWWTGVNGTGSQVSGSEITALTTVATGANHTLYAKWSWPEYSVGDTGPANGKIFYINPSAETDGWKYLEAARLSQPLKVWGTYNWNVYGADGTGIGTGDQNTIDIVGGDLLTTTAADYSFELTNTNPVPNGIVYSDWFLPSRDELALIYSALSVDGVFFTADIYWSSTEYSSTSAWICNFATGNSSSAAKDGTYKTAAIRKY